MADNQDFYEMSDEDLVKFINENQPEEGSADGVQEETTEETVTEPEAEELETETEPEENGEQTESEPEETEDEDDFTRGKSRAELLEMIRNGTRKISEQGNMIAQLRQKPIQRTEQPKEEPAPDQDFIKRLSEQYDSEQLDAIQKLVDYRLQQKEQEKVKQTEAQKHQARTENDAVWNNWKVKNPELANKYQEEIFSAIRQDQASTYDQPGWLLDKLTSIAVNQATGAQANVQGSRSKSVVKRPVRHTASGNAAAKPQRTATRKSVDEMDPDEYIAYMQTKGIDIQTGRVNFQ